MPTGAAHVPDAQSDRQATAAHQPAAPRELTGLALLLDQLDALLRDPTIARALSAFAAKLSAGMRGVLAAITDAARRLPSIRLRLSRRLLLGLLAVTLPVALLALLSSADDERSADGTSAPAAGAPAAAGASPGGGVAMPRLAGAPEKVQPVSVALVLDGTYDGPRRARELRALGTWLAQNHAAGTRVSVIDPAAGRASAPLRPTDLASARLTRQPSSTSAAIRSAFGNADAGRRLLVTVGSSVPAGTSSALRITTRRGATAGAARSSGGGNSRTTIDDRRPDALAASVARGIMAVSGQTERP